ncbi:hypothetical protein CHUAL_012905 [Chamberlinius hualienensis]
MSFNKYMHPRNIYRNTPDFKALAELYPEFQPHVTVDSSGRGHVDFRKHEALRAVTKVLLKHDFQIDFEVPPEHLIPTLPSRLNYILWIEDLLETIPQNMRSHDSSICGLDIGTGATCIYPLLGCKKNGWKFVATDSNKFSTTWARKNVEKNDLTDLIEIVKVQNDSCFLDVFDGRDAEFDFSMCNPPFFNQDEVDPLTKDRSLSRPPPKAPICLTDNEAVTDGGEIAMVNKMLDESIVLKDKIKIYTSMMGKKQSAKSIKKALFQRLGKEVTSFTTTEFCQGHTIRWGVAWTCSPEIKLDQVSTYKRPKEHGIKPISFNIKYTDSNEDSNLEGVLEKVTDFLKELKIRYTQLKVNRQIASLHCNSFENTWSNQRRKRRAMARQIEVGNDVPALNNEPVDKTVPTSCNNNVSQTENGNGSCHTSTTEQNCKLSNFPEEEDSERQILVQFLLRLRRVQKHFVLEMQWLSGSLGKDGCHQIMQYLKNKLG